MKKPTLVLFFILMSLLIIAPKLWAQGLNCVEANGLMWCFNDQACGQPCNEVCAAGGTEPIADNVEQNQQLITLYGLKHRTKQKNARQLVRLSGQAIQLYWLTLALLALKIIKIFHIRRRVVLMRRCLVQLLIYVRMTIALEWIIKASPVVNNLPHVQYVHANHFRSHPQSQPYLNGVLQPWRVSQEQLDSWL